MTQKREPGRGPGGFGVVSTFGSLDGWTFADADEFLSKHSELRRKSITAGGYQHYQFKDGSELWIRPDGQVIRIPFAMYDSDGRPIKGLRITVTTGQIMRSAGWHNLPRHEHEWVVTDDNAN